MPTQSRGFFTCDYCGLACDTLDEAKEHEELHCPKRPQPPHPPQAGHPGQPPYPHRPPTERPPYATMGPLSTVETEGYGPPPYGHPAHQYQKFRSIPLMSPHDSGQGIAPEDCIACQSIELFEATPEHAAAHDANQTEGTPVVVRQVGLRCIHCSKNPLSSSGFSSVFPGSSGAMVSSIRMIADNHLLSCSLAPPEIREACERASKQRQEEGEQGGRNTSEEDGRSRAALLDYCVGLCQHMGIVNKQPHKSGIAFADGEAGVPVPPIQYAAETPASHRGPPGPPYSGERMGPPMSYDRPGYPTPGSQPPHMGRPGITGGAMGSGDAIAPTPLQRRRDRPGGEGAERPPVYSADRSEGGPPSAGYPTPYSQGHPAAEAYQPDIQTPAQPNFEGGEYATPHSAHPSESSPGYSQYELPSNFPYYQEADRTWHCKFCSHVHPQYRDPQAVWSSASGGPPPGNFIDQHLSMCRAYHQSIPSPPMYQGPPPPQYGPPYMPPNMSAYPPPPGWEGHSPPHGSGMPPMQYPPGPLPHEMYGYPPPHMEPPRGYPGAEDPSYGDPRGRLPPGSTGPAAAGQPPAGMPTHTAPPGASRPSGPPGVQRKENMGDAMRHAINHLVARETEYNARDPAAAKTDRLVLEEDKLLLTDYFFHLMKQLRLCRFSESDRKTRGGKREKIKLGYGGLQCIHCADVPNSRKFFWSNVDRLANSFAEIPGHVLKCRRCPQLTKDSLLQLKQLHPEQMARLPRGSQKVFFRRMWRRLHDEDAQANAAASDPSNTENVAPESSEQAETPKATTEAKKEQEESPDTNTSEETALVVQHSATEAAKALADAAVGTGTPASPSSRVLLSVPEDKEWLSDMDCFIRKQLEVFCANEDDVATAKSDRKYPIHVGQVGIRCIHCSVAKGAPGPRGSAVAYPFAISGIYESVREFQRLHLDTCEHLPGATKEKLAAFKGSSSLSSVLRKYYVLAAKALGLHDTREGIRSGGESIPLGSQAAFSFAEGGSGPVAEEIRRDSAYSSDAQGSSPASAQELPAATKVEAESKETTGSGEESDAASGEQPSEGTKESKRKSPVSPEEDEPATKKAKIENPEKDEEPASEPTSEPASEPASGPTTEPATEPASEPALEASKPAHEEAKD